MNRVQKKYHAGNFILLFISILLTLLLAEIALRIFAPVDMERSVEHRVPHPILGWVLKPNLTYVDRISGEDVWVHYNSRGFHDVEHAIENSQGKFRILVLGDSFMEAYSVQLDESFSRQLEHIARSRGADIEVINLGVGGYGTLQEYLLFHTIGKWYKPDIVLLGFYLGNDLTDNSLTLDSMINKSNQIKVACRPFLDISGPEAWNITRIDYEGARHRYLESQDSQDSLLSRLESTSMLLYSALKAAKNMQNKFSPDKDRHHGSPDEQKKRFLAMLGGHYCQEPPEYTKAWFITQSILARLRSEVLEKGGKLIVFSVPDRKEVDIKAMDKIVKKAPYPDMLCLEQSPGYNRLKSILEESGIEYINLLPSFRGEMRNDGKNLFHRRDKHWNREGHRLAAETVISFLREKTYLPSGETKPPLH